MIETHTRPVSILMVGIGGYGELYLKTLWEDVASESYDLCGIVDPIADRSAHFTQVQECTIPVFSKIKDFYGTGSSADLAVIASPIHCHVPQAYTALKHGSNVLCEKPIAGTIQDVETLINARDASGKGVMIGYQWSYSQAIQALKMDIMSGLFGKPIRLRTLCFWPRDDIYYSRNDWAGRIKSDDGVWILDSPVNNAMAHFLHNLFYILGPETHLSAIPQEVTAELYRAVPIENYDTAACRIVTSDGTELLFYGSHVTAINKDPMFRFEFEDAVITFDETSGEIIAADNKGNQKHYGSPDDDHQFRKLFDAIEAVRHPRPIICGPEA
ncbi:hypothetical protein AMJ86_04380, partial [bacterium SM23_57]